MPTPESHLSLNAQEKAVLLKWIKEGAEYKPHWAFEKPVKAKIPRVKDDEWPRNPIDHFVLHKLEEKGLSHSQEAEKEILLRRLKIGRAHVRTPVTNAHLVCSLL